MGCHDAHVSVDVITQLMHACGVVEAGGRARVGVEVIALATSQNPGWYVNRTEQIRHI